MSTKTKELISKGKYGVIGVIMFFLALILILSSGPPVFSAGPARGGGAVISGGGGGSINSAPHHTAPPPPKQNFSAPPPQVVRQPQQNFNRPANHQPRAFTPSQSRIQQQSVGRSQGGQQQSFKQSNSLKGGQNRSFSPIQKPGSGQSIYRNSGNAVNQNQNGQQVGGSKNHLNQHQVSNNNYHPKTQSQTTFGSKGKSYIPPSAKSGTAQSIYRNSGNAVNQNQNGQQVGGSKNHLNQHQVSNNNYHPKTQVKNTTTCKDEKCGGGGNGGHGGKPGGKPGGGGDGTGTGTGIGFAKQKQQQWQEQQQNQKTRVDVRNDNKNINNNQSKATASANPNQEVSLKNVGNPNSESSATGGYSEANASGTGYGGAGGTAVNNISLKIGGGFGNGFAGGQQFFGQGALPFLFLDLRGHGYPNGYGYGYDNGFGHGNGYRDPYYNTYCQQYPEPAYQPGYIETYSDITPYLARPVDNSYYPVRTYAQVVDKKEVVQEPLCGCDKVKQLFRLGKVVRIRNPWPLDPCSGITVPVSERLSPEELKTNWVRVQLEFVKEGCTTYSECERMDCTEVYEAYLKKDEKDRIIYVWLEECGFGLTFVRPKKGGLNKNVWKRALKEPPVFRIVPE